MKLYTYDPAPNPQRLGLFLRYKGIELETTQIDMGTQEQLQDSYKRIVPSGTLPALVLEDGTLLTEVIGQCLYLEALHPDKPLMGVSALDRAQVVSWDHMILGTAMQPIADILRNTSKGFINRALPGPLDVPQLPELAERGALRMQYAWQWLDQRLEGRDWIATDNISLADLDVYVTAQFSQWAKQGAPEDCANVHAHAKRVAEALALG